MLVQPKDGEHYVWDVDMGPAVEGRWREDTEERDGRIWGPRLMKSVPTPTPAIPIPEPWWNPSPIAPISAPPSPISAPSKFRPTPTPTPEPWWNPSPIAPISAPPSPWWILPLPISAPSKFRPTPTPTPEPWWNPSPTKRGWAGMISQDPKFYSSPVTSSPSNPSWTTSPFSPPLPPSSPSLKSNPWGYGLKPIGWTSNEEDIGDDFSWVDHPYGNIRLSDGTLSPYNPDKTDVNGIPAWDDLPLGSLPGWNKTTVSGGGKPGTVTMSYIDDNGNNVVARVYETPAVDGPISSVSQSIDKDKGYQGPGSFITSAGISSDASHFGYVNNPPISDLVDPANPSGHPVSSWVDADGVTHYGYGGYTPGPVKTPITLVEDIYTPLPETVTLDPTPVTAPSGWSKYIAQSPPSMSPFSTVPTSPADQTPAPPDDSGNWEWNPDPPSWGGGLGGGSWTRPTPAIAPASKWGSMISQDPKLYSSPVVSAPTSVLQSVLGQGGPRDPSKGLGEIPNGWDGSDPSSFLPSKTILDDPALGNWWKPEYGSKPDPKIYDDISKIVSQPSVTSSWTTPSGFSSPKPDPKIYAPAMTQLSDLARPAMTQLSDLARPAMTQLISWAKPAMIQITERQTSTPSSSLSSVYAPSMKAMSGGVVGFQHKRKKTEKIMKNHRTRKNITG